MRPEPDGSWRCARCTSGFTREFFEWLQGRLLLYRSDGVMSANYRVHVSR